MRKRSAPKSIRLRGVRQNNLKGISLDLPLGKLTVITGPSGSGKSSLAFDTLFAEGQRRYIETFSPYARQFFDRMDKPQADRIEGIPPAIAIEQRNAVRTTRSTVGTMTEICDYTKVIWPNLAQLYCQHCHQPVRKDTPRLVWDAFQPGADVIITFNLPLSDKLSLPETFDLIAKQGYQRVLLSTRRVGDQAATAAEDGQPADRIITLSEAAEALGTPRLSSLIVIQDRLRINAANRARFAEACEQAYHFGKGKLAIYPVTAASNRGLLAIGAPRYFSNRFHCAACDVDYRPPVPALFSFNHPLGACPACHGFGRIISIDYNLALPDRSKTLAGGAVKPWQSGQSAECQDDLLQFCRRRRIPVNVPFNRLSPSHQAWVLEGDPGYGKDKQHEWPHSWYGIKGYFRWLESRAYKMHVRVLLARYRAYTECPNCHGDRFQPDALLYRVSAPQTKRGRDSGSSGGRITNEGAAGLSIADFYRLPVQDTHQFMTDLLAKHQAPNANDPFRLALEEVHTRLGYLVAVGLGYLTLDRPTRSLSGGETERVNLTTCLGTRLVNTMFILDEPSVGLHPRDTERLIGILHRLRDAGNTVAVVEHEAAIIRAADHVVDLGPGSGEAGGQVVFEGAVDQLLRSDASLTGRCLSGRQPNAPTVRRLVAAPPEAPHEGTNSPALRLSHATLHNLKDLSVSIPLNRFVCVTGVSGSGKTTLIRDLLLPALQEHLREARMDVPRPEEDAMEEAPGPEEPTDTAVFPPCQLEGFETLRQAVLVDQSGLGKTPRSNPAVYSGAFADLRELFADTELARQRGLGASAFSFNSAQGQCGRCRGAGFEKIEMQFLSDVFVRCPDCAGGRYRPHILEVKLQPPNSEIRWSIADLLAATVDEAVALLDLMPSSGPARRARQTLSLLQQVGLGYLRLGQPVNTLSGGESQRLKLVRHLAEIVPGAPHDTPPTLYLFDEPTTGLHFQDVVVLLRVFQKLVDAGHSVLVIEHNLEVVKAADWVIDLGPEAGDLGGELVVEGTPEQVAACAQSYTGQALLTVGVIPVSRA